MTPETNSLIQKLKRDTNDPSEILQQLLSRGEALDQVAKIVEQRAGTVYFLNEPLAQLIASTRSTDLYELVKDRLFRSPWTLLQLYAEGYPDPDIEHELIESLYECAKDPAQPLRTYITKEIAENGSREALSALEAIAYDLLPEAQTAGVLAKASQDASPTTLRTTYLSLIESAHRDFIELVHGAIENIKARENQSDTTRSDNLLGNERASHENGIQSLIERGESKTLEFKQRLGLDVQTGARERKVEDAALKTIVAFLNTSGGTLLIGVADNGVIGGIDKEIAQFKTRDKFTLHFKDLLKTRIGSQFFNFIDYEILEIEGLKILRVDCKASDQPCYLTKGRFFIRTNPASDELTGPELVAYIKSRF
jgi:schlafen family protein